MTVFSVMVKRQKSRFLPSGFLQKSSSQNQKLTFTVKFSPCSSLEATLLFLFVSWAKLHPFVLVHPGLASIFNITTAFPIPPPPPLFSYLYRSLQSLRRTTEIGKFRIPGRPRTSACYRAKERLMRVTFGKKTNKHLKHEEISAGLLESEENIKGLRFWWAPNLLAGLRNQYRTAKGKSTPRHGEKQWA